MKPPSSFVIVQKESRGDACMIYCMFSTSKRNWPPGNGVVVINSNIILKCHVFFFRAAKVLVIPVMTRVGTAEGGTKQKTSIVLPETSPALPPRAKHNDLLTFSLCLATLGFKYNNQHLILWACHLERKFDMESDRR